MLSAASAVLSGNRGSLQQQLLRTADLPVPPQLAPSSRVPADRESPPLPFLELPYFNGIGGFSHDAREYAIYLKPGENTPAPWINVIANRGFGAAISESGLGWPWSGNSQTRRLTPWQNDAVSDPQSEAIYIRDEESGEYWTPTALPIRDTYAYRARHGQGYSVFEFIDDLDTDGISGFLRQWCLWLERGDAAAAEVYLARLSLAVAVPSIRLLAKNPLMLTALAALHLRRHRLPEQRAQLYEQIMDWLGDQAESRHPDRWKKDDLLNKLGTLALAMQEWQGGQKLQIGIDAAAAALGQSIESERKFLEFAQVDSGNVTLRRGELAFWHRSFQEYLAARALSGFPDSKLASSAAKLLYALEGREVLLLLGGRMAESGRERLQVLLETLTRHTAGQKTLERKAQAAGVLGNLFADLAPTKFKPSPIVAKQYEQLRQPVMAIFEKGKARTLGLKTRIAAAEALDQASQSRLRHPGQEDYWAGIKAGVYPLGGDAKAFRSLPAQTVSLSAFRLGRFPVTVWAFERYLSDAALDPNEERKWDEQLLHLSRPVVRVSWEDARLYCEWVSRKWNIRCFLPSEQQWEAAARGVEGRIYPWGGEDEAPDEHRANFGNPDGAPTPVGLFPDGDTPGSPGIADMAGNVWEWTSSGFDKKNKRLRGAAFVIESKVLRAACRCSDPLGDRFGYIGFRCARE